jgi:hypothetical protein
MTRRCGACLLSWRWACSGSWQDVPHKPVSKHGTAAPTIITRPRPNVQPPAMRKIHADTWLIRSPLAQNGYNPGRVDVFPLLVVSPGPRPAHEPSNGARIVCEGTALAGDGGLDGVGHCGLPANGFFRGHIGFWQVCSLVGAQTQPTGSGDATRVQEQCQPAVVWYIMRPQFGQDGPPVN